MSTNEYCIRKAAIIKEQFAKRATSAQTIAALEALDRERGESKAKRNSR